MKWVSRSDLAWPSSEAPSQMTADGVKVHYEGSPVHCPSHDHCVNEVKAIRRSHLANKKENYSDIAYNLLVCCHGYVFEGRGAHKRSGANGSQPLNKAHYAVCALLGSEGDVEPTPEMIEGLKEAILYLREHGAGKEVRGHRDGYATACPGEPLYALVKHGRLEPDGEKPKPVPIYATFPGHSYFRIGRTSKLVTEVGKRLKAEGCSSYRMGPGPVWTNSDKASYRKWQIKLGYSGSDADGIPGPASWKRLKIPRP